MKKWLFFIPVIFLSLSFVNGDSNPCGAGYEMDWDLGRCDDVNECFDSNACPVDCYQCENTLGGFRCYALSGEIFTYGGKPSDFDPTKYNINAYEDWGFHTINAELSAGTWVTLPSGEKIKLSLGVSGNTVIRYPCCKVSGGNLCIKTHLDKPIQYL